MRDSETPVTHTAPDPVPGPLTPRLGIYGQTVGRGGAERVDPETGEVLEATDEADPSTPEAKRRRKYRRARSMAQLLRHKDLAGCHAWATSKVSPVPINAKLGRPRSGFFTGLQTCGLVHLCAHCQPKIAARRALEVQQAMSAWQAEGGRVVMVTLTLSHGRADALRTTLAALKDAGRRFAQHRGFKGLQEAPTGLVGRIVATEITQGQNGWHPHQHQLWFVAGGVDLEQLREVLTPIWQASLVKAGFTASEARGVMVNGGEHAARYVAKMSHAEAWTLADELTRSGSKVGRGGSRSIWQLLDVWADRDAYAGERVQAAELLREYSEATAGLKALTWSPKLKARFGVGEVTDQALAVEAQEDDTYVIALVPAETWPLVAKHRAQADLLTTAEDGGPSAVYEFLALLGTPTPDARTGCAADRPRGLAPAQPAPGAAGDQAGPTSTARGTST